MIYHLSAEDFIINHWNVDILDLLPCVLCMKCNCVQQKKLTGGMGRKCASDTYEAV